MIEYVQYKALNKEDGQIYWLRKVHSTKPDCYFVFKRQEMSDRAYCGVGYCQHYEILEAIPMPGHEQKQENVSRETIPEEKPKKKKLSQMRLF